jgi:Mg-chelatase subunit ChlD
MKVKLILMFIILNLSSCFLFQVKEDDKLKYVCNRQPCPDSICTDKLSSFSKKHKAENPEAVYNIYLIDQSGSMYENFGSSNRMEAAKELAIDYVQKINPKSDTGNSFGLYTFGGYGCNCIHEVQSPFESFNKKELIGKIKQIEPEGLTPISTSLDAITFLLKDKKGKYHINLITDGMETCGGDPELSAQKLSSLSNIKINQMTVEIIIAGIDMSDYEDEELTKIAKAGNGKYQPIKNPESFKSVFHRTSSPTVSKPKEYYELSEKEFKDSIYNRTLEGCPNTDVPPEIIGRCEKNFITIKQNTRKEKDIYHFYLLNSISFNQRLAAYRYFRFHCKPKLNAAEEKMQRNWNITGNWIEKAHIQEALDRLNKCE